LLFPPVCLVCGHTAPDFAGKICENCERSLCDESIRRCPRCAKPLPQYALADLTGCALCRTKRLRFSQVVALGTYGGLTREVVLRIKQVRHESLCLAVGELLAQKIGRDLANYPPDIAVSVPMHWLRKLLRGTNDSELLTEAAAKTLQIPSSAGILRCLRQTRKQGTLLPSERRVNVRGAYGVRSGDRIRDAHVLIVDDVMTTGATANELSRVLLRAGASRVSIGIVARGIGFE
jgi:competence protein ComFC